MSKYPYDFRSGRGMNIKELYYGRKYYKSAVDNIFKSGMYEYGSGSPNYIDLWYEVPFYGRVDPLGQLKVPISSTFKFNLSPDRFIVPPWVYDATLDFITFMNRAKNQGKTGLYNVFGGFNVVRSYRDPFDPYIDHASSIMEVFLDEIIVTSAPIANFDSFLSKFISFFADLDAKLTFSDFFASSKVSVNSTGLAVEFKKHNYNEERPTNQYFKHPEFSKYVQTAANFGFRVNKNCPWQLIADLKSKPMVKYLNMHDIKDVNMLFKQQYVPAIFYDASYLLTILHRFYEKYQEEREYFVQNPFCLVPDPQFRTTQESNVVEREELRTVIQPLPYEEFLKNYSDTDGKIIYILNAIKKIENATTKTKARIEDLFNKRMELLISQGKNTEALLLIADFYNPARIYKNKRAKKPFYSK